MRAVASYRLTPSLVRGGRGPFASESIYATGSLDRR